MTDIRNMSVSQTIKLAGAALAGIFLLILGFSSFTNVDSREILVTQSIAGELGTYTNPGWKFTLGSSTTMYPLRSDYSFGTCVDVTKEVEENGKHISKQVPECTGGLVIRFADGGHATLYGSVSWEVPLDHAGIVKMHKAFHGAEEVSAKAVAKSIESAAYFSGPTMTSLESAAGRRNELLQILNDQILNGVYKTISDNVEVPDPINPKEMKKVVMTRIVLDERGVPVRSQKSYVSEFGIRMLPLSVSRLVYDDAVERQIKSQQESINQVQLAKASATRAEQDAITAAKEGERDATKARWKQETLNATKIGEAQQRVAVANEALKEADLFKKAEILKGEGEATRKRLVMEADGQLDKRLDALVKVNAAYADAIAKYQGNWVPTVNMGGNANGANLNGANALVEMLSAKTAHDLGVDLTPRKK